MLPKGHVAIKRRTRGVSLLELAKFTPSRIISGDPVIECAALTSLAKRSQMKTGLVNPIEAVSIARRHADILALHGLGDLQRVGELNDSGPHRDRFVFLR